MDKYYGNVCELDIIFNFQKAYFILDELLLAGEMQESSKKNVLRCISQQDSLEDIEVSNDCLSYITSSLLFGLPFPPWIELVFMHVSQLSLLCCSTVFCSPTAAQIHSTSTPTPIHPIHIPCANFFCRQVEEDTVTKIM